MYFVTLRLSAHSRTVVSSMSSTVDGRRMVRPYPRRSHAPLGFAPEMAEPTIDDIDALVGPATPHFAYQLRARVAALVADLPGDHPVRKYGEQQMELLDRLGHASSRAHDGPLEPRSRIGWETIPSSAPASSPLPRREE
jgi:hypothetical protein